MFVTEYNLREFDGKSDECLKETRTWPASWDERAKANNAAPSDGRSAGAAPGR
jgi:hypothetical protein